jgi:hypothetical protein
MKRFAFVVVILFTLAFKPSFAIFSSYIGLSAAYANLQKNTASNGTTNINDGLLGVNLGVEADLILTKLALEAFVQGGLLASNTNYENSTFYGVKGKFMSNLIWFDPYIALGFGREHANQGYKNNFILAGFGVQTQFSNYGYYAELNYLTSISRYQGAKTQRIALELGFRYYF